MTDKNPNKFLNVVAGIFLMGFIFFVLKELQSILLPLFIAIIVSFVFFPFHNFLVSKKVPTTIAIIIIVITILLISNIASLFMITSVNSFSAEFPKYELKFLNAYENIVDKLNLSEKEIASINKSMDVKKLLMEGSFTSLITGIV